MGTIYEEQEEEFARSNEMRRFYRALATVQTNAIVRIMQAGTEEARKNQALVETESLMTFTMQFSIQQCGVGLVWDEVLQKCVPIE
jgi:hypothetical protein